MILELILALIGGLIAGTFTGLIPGIHINLVSAWLLAIIASGFFDFVSPIVFVVFICAMTTTHTLLILFLRFILARPMMNHIFLFCQDINF